MPAVGECVRSTIWKDEKEFEKMVTSADLEANGASALVEIAATACDVEHTEAAQGAP